MTYGEALKKQAAAKERKKKRRAKVPNRQTRIKRIKKELSQLWSKAVRARDGNRCLMCGKSEYLHSHHWLFRKGHSMALAFDVRNGASLDYGCHLGRIHHDGDGEFIMRFLAIMRDKIGAAAIADMEEIARHPEPISLERLEEIRDGFLEPWRNSQSFKADVIKLEHCYQCGELFDPKTDQYHRSECADRNKP